MSGGTEDARRQLQLEVRAVHKQHRQRLLAEAGVAVEVDTTQALAIKADLAITWYCIRILSKIATTYRLHTYNVEIRIKSHVLVYLRWLKSWNISLASEGKQRELVHELTDGASGEYILFSFPDQHRRHIMKPAPCVWIGDFEKKITDTLDYNDRYMYMYVTETWYTQYINFMLRENQLIWHSGLIQSKLMKFGLRLGGGGGGGDKGGGTMKTSFQIYNIANPNIFKNSMVFSIVEASDTYTNLKIALEPFKHQINQLCGKILWYTLQYTHNHVHVHVHTVHYTCTSLR